MVGSRGHRGLSHAGKERTQAGETGQVPRNRLEGDEAWCLVSRAERTEPVGAETPRALWGRGLLTGSPAGLQAQPWHLNG